MGVKVRERDDAWWLFIDYKGKRKAKRVGKGAEAKKAANLAAIKIQARLAEGDLSPLEDVPSRSAITFQDYATQWLATHANQACKFSTARIYEANLRLHVYPIIGTKPIPDMSRIDCRALITACREKK